MPLPSRLRALVTPLLLLVIAFIAARSINYVSALRPGPDAGVYSAVGMQLLEGKALYRETLDAKPPVIYMLNAAALGLGDRTFHSIRILERFFAVAGAVLVFFLVRTIFTRRSLAALAALGYAFIATNDAVYEEGNVTEEYATVFVLAGILLIVLAVLREPKWRNALAAGAGACFAFAVFTKEPFLLSSGAWFLLLVALPRDGWKPAVRRGVLFVLGALAPALVFFGYLLARGDLPFWLERVSGSMGYIASLDTQGSWLGRLVPNFKALGSALLVLSRTGSLGFLAGLVAAVAIPTFARRYHLIPRFFVVAFVLEFAGATLSPALYGHYFLQVVPSFVLCASAAGALLLDLGERLFRRAWPGLVILVFLPWLLDFRTIDTYRRLLQQPFARAEAGPVARFVRDHAEPGDTLWVSSLACSRFYVESGLGSPTIFIHYFAGWFTDTRSSTGAQKLDRLKSDLSRQPPPYVITTNDTERLLVAGVLGWLCDGYTRAAIEDQGFSSPVRLYVRNDRAPKALPAAMPAQDDACAQVFVNRGHDSYQRGEWRQAVDASVKALALDPRNVAAFNNLCVSFLQLRDYDQAAASCEAALAIEPDNALARSNLAWVRAERAKK